MKKAISTWSFYGDWDLKQKMIIARDAGFTGFEPEFTEDGELALDGDVESWKKVRAMADEIGIELSGLATGLYWGATMQKHAPKLPTSWSNKSVAPKRLVSTPFSSCQRQSVWTSSLTAKSCLTTSLTNAQQNLSKTRYQSLAKQASPSQ